MPDNSTLTSRIDAQFLAAADKVKKFQSEQLKAAQGTAAAPRETRATL